MILFVSFIAAHGIETGRLPVHIISIYIMADLQLFTNMYTLYSWNVSSLLLTHSQISWGLKQLDYKVYVLGALAFECRNTYTLKRKKTSVSIPHLSHLYNVLTPVFFLHFLHIFVLLDSLIWQVWDKNVYTFLLCVIFFFSNRFHVAACWQNLLLLVERIF